MSAVLQAPFPYFGGKSKIASAIWKRFGKVNNFVDPFCGSCAVLFANPNYPHCIETLNDKDGLLVNAFRAIRGDPEQTAYYADRPVIECDLHAIHTLLVREKPNLVPCLEADIDFFDAKLAGYWLYGMCVWIGGEFCSGKGPWQAVDGKLVDTGASNGGSGMGIQRRRPHLGDAGIGIQRRLPHLGDAGKGIQRKTSIQSRYDFILDWFIALSDRLNNVRICCGDWSRVLGPSPTYKQGMTAVLLDPPYSSEAGRDPEIYTEDCLEVSKDALRWALENGNNPLLRIAVCGYDNEFKNIPPGWFELRWKTGGGYGSQSHGRGRVNAKRETVWFSPHCINPELSLFGTDDLFDENTDYA